MTQIALHELRTLLRGVNLISDGSSKMGGLEDSIEPSTWTTFPQNRDESPAKRIDKDCYQVPYGCALVSDGIRPIRFNVIVRPDLWPTSLARGNPDWARSPVSNARTPSWNKVSLMRCSFPCSSTPMSACEDDILPAGGLPEAAAAEVESRLYIIWSSSAATPATQPSRSCTS